MEYDPKEDLTKFDPVQWPVPKEFRMRDETKEANGRCSMIMITKEQIDRLCELEKAMSKDWFVRKREIAGRVVDAELKSNAVVWGGKIVGWTVVGKLSGDFTTSIADMDGVAEIRNAAVPLLSAARKLLEIKAECEKYAFTLEERHGIAHLSEVILKIIGE